MSPHDRAAQFKPFAALTGYETVLRETGRLTNERAGPTGLSPGPSGRSTDRRGPGHGRRDPIPSPVLFALEGA